MRVFIAVDLDEAVRREIAKLLKTLKKKHWPVAWEEIKKLHITLVFLGDLEIRNDFQEEAQSSKLKTQNHPPDSLQRQLPRSGRGNLKLKTKELKKIIKKSTFKIEPFPLSFKGLGCFPDYDWPGIIWLGLKGDLKSLAALQKKIRNNLAKAGFDFGKKPFHPHITLGRIKKARAGQRREIGRQIKKLRILNLESRILVDRILVYQSKCLPKGSVYTKLLEIPLLAK